jgi:Methyltransferase domain
MSRSLFERLRRVWQQFKDIHEETRVNTQRLDRLSEQVSQFARENRLLLGYLSLPPDGLWRDKGHWVDGGPAVLAFPYSTPCRQESFEQPYFPYWSRRLAMPLSYHRKAWEHVFICQALWERGALRPDAKGLGFGVGREPLTALFASEECDIVATDMAATDATEMGWSESAQHAAGLETLRKVHICPGPQFDRRASFQVCDMTDIPEALAGFDFCWSACALEHLGSIEQGLRFVERSIDCLKPGGWAVHTTEFNISSNEDTITEGGTVLFRRRDMLALEQRLTARGHKVAPFDFNSGTAPLDRYIDVAPYRAEPHLKLALEGYASTSIGIIVQRAEA